MSPTRVGVLVLRLWLEEGAEPRLRARLTGRLDVARSEETSAGAAGADDTLALVRSWIDQFVAAASGDAAVTDR